MSEEDEHWVLHKKERETMGGDGGGGRAYTFDDTQTDNGKITYKSRFRFSQITCYKVDA